MSFRRRNAPIESVGPASQPQSSRLAALRGAAVPGRVPILNPPTPTIATKGRTPTVAASGTRPSGLTNQPTVSTGISSLDGLLAGHGGVPLGSVVVISQAADWDGGLLSSGADYGSVLARVATTQAILSDQPAWILGLDKCTDGDEWRRRLPGLVEPSSSGGKKRMSGRDSRSDTQPTHERMKIAWRYELTGVTDGTSSPSSSSDGFEPNSFRHPISIQTNLSAQTSAGKLSFFPFSISGIESISDALAESKAGQVYRLILPSIPAATPAGLAVLATWVTAAGEMMARIRALARRYSDRLVVFLVVPSVVQAEHRRWIELLSDAVIEIVVPPAWKTESQPTVESTGNNTSTTGPKALLKIKKMPILTDRGGSGQSIAAGTEYEVVLGRAGVEIKAYVLPPVDGVEEPAEQNKMDF